MRAATFTTTGHAREVLHVGNVATPEVGPGEVRVRIAASGVNPSDVKRRGAQPAGSAPEFPLVIPHSDGAGTIDAVGAGVATTRVGERVWVFNAQYRRAFGTAAEYCVVASEFAVPLPDGVDFAVGACMGIPALTAYHAIALDGSVAGQTLLVQGGAGAVGHYAIQFAKRDGATVIATVSSAAKAEHARNAGADHVLDYRTDDLKARVAELTGGTGVDRIIEVDVAANAMTYPDLIAEYGKAVVYGSGKPVAQIPGAFIPRSTTLQYFLVYRLRADERAKGLAAIDAGLRDGSLKHEIANRVPLDEIARAHELVEQGGIGNTVVLIP